MSAAGQGVVVTGMGATTPLGGDVQSTWDGLLAGRSGARPIEDDWPARFELPVDFASQLAVEPSEILKRVELRRLDRSEQVAIIAARQAWEHADLGDYPATDGGSPKVDGLRLAVIIGTGIGGATTLLGQDDLLEQQGLRKVAVLTIPMLMPNGPAAHVGLEFGAAAGIHAPVSACASGAEAIAWGWRMLQANEVDVVVAGGAEACIAPITLAGFCQARTMAHDWDDPAAASRPFDAKRNGFVLGEGAGMVVLERAEFAEARGATIHGRIAGIGTSADAYHITAPDPEGTGQSRAIAAALRTAGLEPSDIGHVNCHATSTPVGDVAETVAVRKAIGDHPVLTAPKGSLGHLLGAAGAVEAIATILAVKEGQIPPTANLTDLDGDVELDVVSGEARKVQLDAAINDSFGFGGHNVSLCVM
ncbi:beta-ketoacyl-[acyl-carrier-protein] synthase family protein [Actinomycetospora termitidis]|uniref:Beta-ketoacyl-[acyl-carrier-protein] synthase family protein n=1 Tax=Actinomycetospora termitidis TaxID=3053470 RepID=A0ABT7MEB5_9PSEU|nr:beta-ketoacyl-[acyl-carrier-protein] synthase family protein [Actinomycetospora sp. Odt1-22]MDL5158801.1 beta-ketoacyl-[acyl-carrier-protein] synthase family protein [Actinomycetospora sp. Odt1-22]